MKNVDLQRYAAFNEQFGTMAGVLRWKMLQNSKLSDSWQM